MKAVEIASIDFSPFGILYDMEKEGKGTGQVNRDSGDGWRDANSAIPIIDTQSSLGYTVGSSAPFIAAEMERHLHTQEALFCAGQPIIFLIATFRNDAAPSESDIIPVILRPGQVAVLHRGTWHSSAHGLYGETAYYYLALCHKNEPTVWKEIIGGPISIEVPNT